MSQIPLHFSMENQGVPSTPGSNFRCISVSQERNVSSEISKVTPTFSTMADSLELVSTLYDVGRRPEKAMSAYKPEVVINQERYEISARFQRILYIIDHVNIV